MKDAEEYYKEHESAPLPDETGLIYIDENELFKLMTDFSQSQQGEMVRVDENGSQMEHPDNGYDFDSHNYSSALDEYNKARQIPLAQYELEQKLIEAKDEIERLNGCYQAELLKVQCLKKIIEVRNLEIERLRSVIKKVDDACIHNESMWDYAISTETVRLMLEDANPPSNEPMKGSDE